MLYAVESTLATELEPGDIICVGNRNFHVTGVGPFEDHIHVLGLPYYDDDIDYGGVWREIEDRPESYFCLRTNELIDRVIFSGEREEFDLEDEI